MVDGLLETGALLTSLPLGADDVDASGAVEVVPGLTDAWGVPLPQAARERHIISANKIETVFLTLFSPNLLIFLPV
jgi:hypothetical protein